MKYLSICSGIEAATVAWHGFGWEPVGFSEIEAFPSAVLAHRFPDVPNFGDMTKFKNWNLNASDVNLLVGGTPCQSFSVAGLRKGLSDDRGNLALTFCEMADHFDPEWVLWENVPGVLSSKDNAFGCFLAGLCGADEPFDPNGRWDGAGLVSGPKRTIAWRVLDAQYFGVAQRRRRVFVLAVRGAGNWAAARALFPVGESVFWDSAPSREKRKGFAAVAGTLAANGGGLNRPAGNCDELDFCGPVGQWWDGGQTASTLTKCNADGAQRMPDKDNFGAVLQPVAIQGNLIGREAGGPQGVGASDDGVMYTLTKADVHGVAQPIAFGLEGDVVSDDLMETITTREGCITDTSHAVAFGGDIARTLQARHDSSPCADRGMDVVATAMRVRRLTPIECERLQGFPDGWTAIPWRGKPAEDCPDGPRYKALGNSMAVPVMRWIGNRIKRIETP